jgi:hypothetical protein
MPKTTNLTGGALVLAAITACYSANSQTNAPVTAAVAAGAPSAGLLNDWLRKESDVFQPWDFGGQVRARLEHKKYFAAPGQAGAIDFREHGGNPDNTYLLMRETAHAGYNADWWSIFVEGRVSHTEWGDDRNPNPETDALDFHQLYITVGNKKEFPLTLKVGRQELIYGDERLIGAADWLNLTRVFDGAKLRYEDKNFWVDAFVTRPVLYDDRNLNWNNEYEWFSGIYASTKTLVPKQETQLYFLARNAGEKSPRANEKGFPQAGGASPRDIYTVGARVKSLPGQLNGFDYGAEVAGQFGKWGSGATEIDHEAFAAYVGGGYTFEKAWGTPRVGVEYNYASGDKDPKDDKHETFENLFPTNHKFYGYMDFVSLQNIQNVRFMTSIKPHKKLTLTLDYHLFWLADTADSFYTVAGAPRGGGGVGTGTGFNRNKGYDSFVGSEIDLIGTYNIAPWAAVQVGYGHFFTGKYIDQSLSAPAFGSKDADYVYCQATFNF